MKYDAKSRITGKKLHRILHVRNYVLLCTTFYQQYIKRGLKVVLIDYSII